MNKHTTILSSTVLVILKSKNRNESPNLLLFPMSYCSLYSVLLLMSLLYKELCMCVCVCITWKGCTLLALMCKQAALTMYVRFIPGIVKSVVVYHTCRIVLIIYISQILLGERSKPITN